MDLIYISIKKEKNKKRVQYVVFVDMENKRYCYYLQFSFILNIYLFIWYNDQQRSKEEMSTHNL